MASKITAFRLQNFMGYVDTDWIEFRPITLLFGRNSSGKSALIRAILLLRQSLQAESKPNSTEPIINVGKQREPLNFIADKGVDLGSFWQMINNHAPFENLPDQKDAQRQMVFSFRCQITLDALKEIDAELPFGRITSVDLSLNFQLSEQGISELSAITMELSPDNEGKALDRRVILQAELFNLNDWQGWYFSNHFQQHNELYYTTDTKFLKDNPDDTRITWRPRFRILTSTGFLPAISVEAKNVEGETKATESIAIIFNQCCEAIKSWLSAETLWRLGPIRSAPRRTYRPAELSQHEWDASGEAVVFEYIRSFDEKSEQQQRINESIEKLTIGKKLRVFPLTYQRLPYSEATPDAFQIMVFKDDDSRGVNLMDVGYGASQIVPIVLKVWSAPEKTFGIIEQPELHLHPKAQAELADLFIKAVNITRDNQSPPTHLYLIETHSEHLILRLLRRICETTEKKIESESLSITSANVQVLYIRTEDHGSKIYQLAITPDGDFEEKWPDGFFDERIAELC